MAFVLNQSSQDKLLNIKKPLADVVNKAISYSLVEFFVGEALRTPEHEAELVAAGKSETMHSRHLTGDAVDLIAKINGVVSWEEKYYHQIADAMLKASAQLQIPIVWGGSWQTLKDFDHFELNRLFYP